MFSRVRSRKLSFTSLRHNKNTQTEKMIAVDLAEENVDKSFISYDC